MGEVLSAIQAVKQTKSTANAAGFGSADSSDPGAQLMSDPLSSIYPQMPDFSGQGQNQAQGGMPQMDAPQMPDQGMPQMAAPQAPPVDNPYDGQNYSNAQDIAQSIGQGGNDDVTVSGDAWAPKKENGLGRIMDTLLELRGRRPVFKDRTDDANLQSAMENAQGDDKPGFDQQKLISRIRKFNPEMADKMANTLDTQTRLQGNLDRSNKVFDLKESEIYRDRVASRLNGANAETYPKLRALSVRYLEKAGHPEIAEELPDAYDKYDVNSFVMGEVPVKDQLRIGQSDQRIAETGRHHEVTEGQGDTRNAETGRHNQATESQAATNEGGRNDRHDETPHARSGMTKYGPGVVSKDGTKMVVSRGGKQYGYIKTGSNNWTPVGEVNVK